MQQSASQHVSATNNPASRYWFQILYPFSVQLHSPSLTSLIPYFLHCKHLQTLLFFIQLNNILPSTCT